MTTIYDYRTICDICGKVRPTLEVGDSIPTWYNLSYYLPLARRNADDLEAWLESRKDWDFCCFEHLEQWVAKRREEGA